MAGEGARPTAAPPATAGEMLERGREFLARKGVPGGRLDAELLVADALGLDRLHLFLQLDRPVTAVEVDAGRARLVRRGQREPTAYITGRREFYGRGFEVDAAVLIPRPETELLVDLARERLKGRVAPRVADVGTGSGCIAISVALEHPGAELCALDASAAALELARRNASALEASTVRCVEGDGPAGLPTEAPYDLILSNPPYVTRAEWERLEPEVRDHEPRAALLLPGDDPRHWLERLVDETRALLRPGAPLLIELGASQAQAAGEVCRSRGLEFTLHRDLAGVERVLEVQG